MNANPPSPTKPRQKPEEPVDLLAVCGHLAIQGGLNFAWAVTVGLFGLAISFVVLPILWTFANVTPNWMLEFFTHLPQNPLWFVLGGVFFLRIQILGCYDLRHEPKRVRFEWYADTAVGILGFALGSLCTLAALHHPQ